MEDSYLPIGTIVILKNTDQKIMITGYFGSEKDKLMHEYRGVFYPEGLAESNKAILFNHKKIKEIVYSGLKDEEYTEFSKKIVDISKKYTSIMFKVTTKVLTNVLGGEKNV